MTDIDPATPIANSRREPLEERGWIKGTWVEKAGERRRRFYRVTVE
jgi:hypothetical protein